MHRFIGQHVEPEPHIAGQELDTQWRAILMIVPIRKQSDPAT